MIATYLFCFRWLPHIHCFDDCHISTVLQPSRSFCTNLPLFVVSFPPIQWIIPLAICDVLKKARRNHDYKTRDAGGLEMLTAHLASGLLPIFTSKSSPQKSGGNPHHVTTHKSASAGAVATTHPHHVKPELWELCSATADQRLSQHLTALRKDGQ